MTNVVIPEITPKKHFPVRYKHLLLFSLLTPRQLMTGAQGAVFAVSSVLGPVLGAFTLREPRAHIEAHLLQVASSPQKRLGDGFFT